METCKSKYGEPKNVSKTLKDIENFCNLLRNNKVKDSKEAFVKLPLLVQCLFLHHAWDIISHKSKHSEESYLNAFYLFKLFRGKEMRESDIYSKYGKLKTLEKYYKQAREANSGEKSTSGEAKKSTGKRVSKKYSKEYQRYESPTDELDPLFIFYTSLYKQNPRSKLAIRWLTEHGVYEGVERENLIKVYKKLEKL